MDWRSVAAPPESVAIAQRAVLLTAGSGFSERVWSRASEKVTGDENAWRVHFPGGTTEALWFISAVSDASMAAAFATGLADDLAAVAEERFAQNRDLKPFVFRVMLYDLRHPVQAVWRMQRTATIMDACRHSGGLAGGVRLAAINMLYTLTVMVWLVDRRGGRLTRMATRLALGRL